MQMLSPFATFVPSFTSIEYFIPSEEEIRKQEIQREFEIQICKPIYRADIWKSLPSPNEFEVKQIKIIKIVHSHAAGILNVPKSRSTKIRFNNNVTVCEYKMIPPSKKIPTWGCTRWEKFRKLVG